MASQASIILATSALALTISHSAQAITLYESDYNDLSNIPGSTAAGSPSVGSFGSLDGNALIFNNAPGTQTDEQIRLSLPSQYKHFNVSFDIETEGLKNSLYNFGAIFDTPSVQRLDWHGSSGIDTFNSGGSAYTSGSVGSFVNGQASHVDIAIDMIAQEWLIEVSPLNNLGSSYNFTGNFYGSEMRSLRFDLSPWHGSATNDPSVSVAIDNLLVTAEVPVPAAAWLFGSALLGLGSIKRKH